MDVICNTIKQSIDLKYRGVILSAEGDTIHQRICEVRTSSAYLELPPLTDEQKSETSNDTQSDRLKAAPVEVSSVQITLHYRCNLGHCNILK